MLRELYRNPEKGFLGAETFVYWPGVALLQYWRSFEDLEKFARSPDDPHLPAWQRFNRTVGSDGSVGIFHETFIVERGNYGNMPVFGLARAAEHVRHRRTGDGQETPDAWRERTRCPFARITTLASERLPSLAMPCFVSATADADHDSGITL